VKQIIKKSVHLIGLSHLMVTVHFVVIIRCLNVYDTKHFCFKRWIPCSNGNYHPVEDGEKECDVDCCERLDNQWSSIP